MASMTSFVLKAKHPTRKIHVVMKLQPQKSILFINTNKIESCIITKY